ncbi:MAG TPA: CHASE2 domain-containing protein, partial [Tepidisphaeraceae bacterium]
MKSLKPRRLPIWGDIPFRTRVVVLGVALTVGVLVMEFAGALRPFEGWLYDTRARHCQFFSPAPTTQLVHLDIDDTALEAYGPYPWKRGRRIFAGAVDELREAGAKALALDITFGDEDTSDGQEFDDTPMPGPTTSPSNVAEASTSESLAQVSTKAPPATGPASPPGFSADAALNALQQQDEQALAEAVERFGRVVVPTDFEIRFGSETELERVVREQLRLNLELTPEEMSQWLQRFGGKNLRNVSRDALIDAFVVGRKQVALEKLVVAPDQPIEQLLPRETHGGQVHSVRSPLQKLVEKKRAQARSILAMDRLYFREVPSEMSDLLVTRSQAPPIEPLTEALWRAKANGSGTSGIIGSVNYAKDALSPDGVVRSVPLLVNDRGHLLPQFGLALVCTVLGVDPTNREEFTASPDQIVLSPPGSTPIVIPIYTQPAHGRIPAIGACFAIPWFGGRDWRTMYDWPRHAQLVNHIPFTLAADIQKKRADLRLNERNRARAGDDIALLRKFGGLPPANPA